MDNGTEFFTDFKQILDDKKIGISKTIPYMPQSNSIVERANGVIKRNIKKINIIIRMKIILNGHILLMKQLKYTIIQKCFNRKNT